jgi:hypothetical protein
VAAVRRRRRRRSERERVPRCRSRRDRGPAGSPSTGRRRGPQGMPPPQSLNATDWRLTLPILTSPLKCLG